MESHIAAVIMMNQMAAPRKQDDRLLMIFALLMWRHVHKNELHIQYVSGSTLVGPPEAHWEASLGHILYAMLDAKGSHSPSLCLFLSLAYL